MDEIEALDGAAEHAGAITEAVTESVVEAAADAIERAQAREEQALEIVEQITESARASEIVQQARQGDTELWNSLNAVAADLASQKSELATLSLSLTEIQSILLSMRPAEPTPSLETPSSISESSEMISEALADPLATSLPVAVDAQEAPALTKRRKVL